jgi:hypothetical protein
MSVIHHQNASESNYRYYFEYDGSCCLLEARLKRPVMCIIYIYGNQILIMTCALTLQS